MLKPKALGGMRERGFSLVELAIVLVIIGVLVGSFISTLGSRIDTTRRSEAVKQMETIKQALYGYAMTQASNSLHLPCPDCSTGGCIIAAAAAGAFIGDGVEDLTPGGACAAGSEPGYLPWVTLGLGAADPWSNRYSYWVSSSASNHAVAAGFTLTAFVAGTMATINTRVGNLVPVVSTSAVAIIMSHGKNGYGGRTSQDTVNSAVPVANVDEVENLDNDLLFISRSATDAGAATAGGEFDDILVWISEYELKAKMVEAGLLP